MNTNDRVVFVGHYSSPSESLGGGASAAGNQVQRQILKEMVFSCPREDVVCYSMEPLPSWPNGPFFSKYSKVELTEFLPYINLPGVKHFLFSCVLFFKIFVLKPVVCVQYNSYFFENIVLLICRFFSRNMRVSLIVQDVHAGIEGSIFRKKNIRAVAERMSLRLARFFDLIVPISDAIKEDFCLDESKVIVFQGGVTDFSQQLMAFDSFGIEDVGVFAGALEPHNGAGVLVQQWISLKIPYVLHVFGRGSLSAAIESMASETDRVVFHGFQPERTILQWQSRARWNFCLRFSLGLDQRYFFPSKFFNVMASPGSVVVNNFYGLQTSLRNMVCLVSDDLSDLNSALRDGFLASSETAINQRRKVLLEAHSWRACVFAIFKRLGATKDSK